MQRRPTRLLVFVTLVVTGMACHRVGRGATRHARQRRSSITVTAPPPGSVRVLYSLDAKQNDREVVALIDAAKVRAWFAMYEFTLEDVADALVKAKERGVDVRGVVDQTESAKSYDAPVIGKLVAAGIPVETQHHADGRGIMHVKALVTESAYALGSYNWTRSATDENDELLEIGTDPALVKVYSDFIGRLLERYRDSPVGAAAKPVDCDFTDAPAHVGELAHVHGTVVDAHVSKSGTVFLDFCRDYAHCPFSAVVFAADAARFGSLSRLAGHRVTLTGRISSYRGRDEIKLTDPSQLSSE